MLLFSGSLVVGKFDNLCAMTFKENVALISASRVLDLFYSRSSSFRGFCHILLNWPIEGGSCGNRFNAAQSKSGDRAKESCPLNPVFLLVSKVVKSYSHILLDDLSCERTAASFAVWFLTLLVNTW